MFVLSLCWVYFVVVVFLFFCSMMASFTCMDTLFGPHADSCSEPNGNVTLRTTSRPCICWISHGVTRKQATHGNANAFQPYLTLFISVMKTAVNPEWFMSPFCQTTWIIAESLDFAHILGVSLQIQSGGYTINAKNTIIILLLMDLIVNI